MNRLIAVCVVAGGALAAVGCNTTPAQDGAVVGGALGAGLGAVVGHQSGRQGEGALIGAGLGALTGALVGDDVGRRQQQQYHAPARVVAPSAAPVAYAPATGPVQGRYETRLVHGPNGERYEQRVWVPYR